MDIKDIRELKKKLETELLIHIAQKVEQFKVKTGVRVLYVDVDQDRLLAVGCDPEEGEEVILGVNVRIEL